MENKNIIEEDAAALREDLLKKNKEKAQQEGISEFERLNDIKKIIAESISGYDGSESGSEKVIERLFAVSGPEAKHEVINQLRIEDNPNLQAIGESLEDDEAREDYSLSNKAFSRLQDDHARVRNIVEGIGAGGQESGEISEYRNQKDPYMAAMLYFQEIKNKIGIEGVKKLNKEDIIKKIYKEFYGGGPEQSRDVIEQWHNDYDKDIGQVKQSLSELIVKGDDISWQPDLYFNYLRLNGGPTKDEDKGRIYFNLAPGMAGARENVGQFFEKVVKEALGRGVRIDVKVPRSEEDRDRLYSKAYEDEEEVKKHKPPFDETYRRADKMVLYFSPDQQEEVSRLIQDLAPTANFLDDTPRFTKTILPGIGFGQEPPKLSFKDKTSFGLERSKALANVFMQLSKKIGDRDGNFTEFPEQEFQNMVKEEFGKLYIDSENPAFNSGGEPVFGDMLRVLGLAKNETSKKNQEEDITPSSEEMNLVIENYYNSVEKQIKGAASPEEVQKFIDTYNKNMEPLNDIMERIKALPPFEVNIGGKTYVITRITGGTNSLRMQEKK